MNVFLLFTIFLIPLLPAVGYFGYEQIKVLFFIFATTALSFMLNKGFKWSIITRLGAVFLLVLFIASLFGKDPKISILGKDPYYEGLIIYVFLFLFYLIIKKSRPKLQSVALALSLSSLLVAVIAIREWILLNIFKIPVQTYADRVVSTFGQPNFYSGFLLLTLPFSYILFKSPNKYLKYIGWGGGLFSGVGILISYSRSAIVIFLLLLILGLIAQLKNKFKIGLLVSLVIFVSILLALKFASGLVGNEMRIPLLTNNPDLTKESVEKRIYIWPQAFKIALQRPFFGYGLENISSAFEKYFEENNHKLFEENLKIDPVLISMKDLNIDRSHNYMLDLFLFSGISGVLAWFLFVILLLLKAKKTLLVALLTYLVWVQFQNQSIVHLIYFWLLAGIIDKSK